MKQQNNVKENLDIYSTGTPIQTMQLNGNSTDFYLCF